MIETSGKMSSECDWISKQQRRVFVVLQRLYAQQACDLSAIEKINVKHLTFLLL